MGIDTARRDLTTALRGRAVALGFAIGALAACGAGGGASGTSGSGTGATTGASAGGSHGTTASGSGSTTGSPGSSSGGRTGTSAGGKTSGGTSGGASTSAGAGTSGGTTGSGGASTGASGLWVTGYYTGWDSSSYPISAVDFAALSHVVVGPVLPNSDGTLDTTFSLGNAGPAWATSAVQAAHGAGDVALLWVGGSGSESGFLGATSNLSTFVSNLDTAMSQFGADGVDLDWEPLASSDESSFTSLLQALRQASPSAVLTMPVGALNMNTDGVDPFYASAAEIVDQMNLMTYGVSGAWEGWESWHSSPLSGESSSTPISIDTSVPAYLAAGVPAAKLGIGVGFFGLCYTPPVTGPKQQLGSSTVAASDGVMTYAAILSDYAPAMTYTFDPVAQVPYLGASTAVGPEGCTFISYDDPASVAAKAQYVKANGLGGTIIWELAEGFTPDAPDGGNALLDAVGAAFR